LIYVISGGDLVKKAFVEENITYEEAMRWMMFRRFEEYAARENASANE
jgi:hypothetical protein